MTWWNKRGYRGSDYYGGYTRKKTVNEFKREVEGTTPTLGRTKVTVSFEGKSAGINDDQVVFPALNPTEELSTNEVDVFRGFVDTKSSLFRFSDMDYIKDNRGLKKKNPLLHNLFSLIEEARVAREYCHDYIGAKRNVGSLFKDLATKAIILEQEGQNHLYGPAITSCVMDRLGGSYMWNEQKAFQEAGLDMEKMREYADVVFDLESTEGSMELAKRIYEEVENEDDDDDQGQGDGDEDEDNGDDGQNGEEDSEQKEQKGGGKKKSDRYVDTNDVVNELTEEKFQSSREGGADIYRVPTTEDDVVLHWDHPKFHRNLSRYDNLMDELSSSVPVLKRKIELLIQSTRKLDWERRQEYGRFDSRRLIGAYNHEPDVFKVRDDRSDLDTAISLVVDMSGSMAYTKAQRAMQTCGLLAECLQKIGVPFEILGFDAQDDMARSTVIKAENSDLDYARYNNLCLYEFKRFSDRWFDARHYMGNMYVDETKRQGWGGPSEIIGFNQNVDGESISLASERLMKRGEKRKMMFVLSDGQPAGETDNSRLLHEHLMTTIKRISNLHDIIGIGIESDAPRHYYPNHVILQSAEELPEMSLKLLEDAILDKKNYIKDENKIKFDEMEAA